MTPEIVAASSTAFPSTPPCILMLQFGGGGEISGCLTCYPKAVLLSGRLVWQYLETSLGYNYWETVLRLSIGRGKEWC